MKESFYIISIEVGPGATSHLALGFVGYSTSPNSGGTTQNDPLATGLCFFKVKNVDPSEGVTEKDVGLFCSGGVKNKRILV